MRPCEQVLCPGLPRVTGGCSWQVGGGCGTDTSGKVLNGRFSFLFTHEKTRGVLAAAYLGRQLDISLRAV